MKAHHSNLEPRGETMESSNNAFEAKQYNQQVIELTPEMEIPPERRRRIYDLTEALRLTVGSTAATAQPVLVAQTDPEEIQSNGDADVSPTVSASPDIAPEDRQTGSIDCQDQCLDTAWESLTEQPHTEPQSLSMETESYGSDVEPPLTADIGMLADETEETIVDSGTLCPTTEPRDDGVDLRPYPDEPDSEETVLERFIRTQYESDLDRIIDSVVAKVVRNKISALMPAIS